MALAYISKTLKKCSENNGIPNAIFQMIGHNYKRYIVWNTGYLIYKNDNINIHKCITIPVSILGQCHKNDGKKKFYQLLFENQNVYKKLLKSENMTEVRNVCKALTDNQNLKKLQKELSDLIILKENMELLYQKKLKMEGKEIIVGYKETIVSGEYIGMEKKQASIIVGYTEPGFYTVNDDLYSEKPEKKYYSERSPIYNTRDVMVPQFKKVTIQEPIISKTQAPEMDFRYDDICKNIHSLSERIATANDILN